MRVLVTGGTGYIGGRLVPRLLRERHAVRVMVRDPSRLAGRPWTDRVEVVQGNLLEPETLAGAFEDVSAAYFLVHSMYAGADFAQRDRQAALNFSRAASGLRHVIYLGGLQPERRLLSQHLHSRAEIGRILSLRTTSRMESRNPSEKNWSKKTQTGCRQLCCGSQVYSVTGANFLPSTA